MAIRRGIAVVFGLIGWRRDVVRSPHSASISWPSNASRGAVGATLIVRVSGDFTELPPDNLVRPIHPAARVLPSVRAIVENIRKAKVDTADRGAAADARRYRGAVLGQDSGNPRRDHRLPEVGQAGLAYLEYGGDREYYLATACDKIS